MFSNAQGQLTPQSVVKLKLQIGSTEGSLGECRNIHRNVVGSILTRDAVLLP